MTEKENYLRIYRGEMPEWVPRINYATKGKHPACKMVMPSPLSVNRLPGGAGFDEWGVEYIGTKEMGMAALPVPGKYLIEDITKWRDVVHPLDLSQVDWEAAAKKDLAAIDRNETVVQMQLGFSYFLTLSNMMGYVEGCCALIEEPEACMELLEFMSEWKLRVQREVLKYYKPDIWCINDDLSTADSPFISLETYRKFFKPFHKKEFDQAKEAGCYLDFHCCGKAEEFIPDWLEMGVRSWQPAQVANDLPKLHEMYDDRLIFVGCWDSQGPAGWNTTGEEFTKECVKKCIEENAKKGNFIFWGSAYGDPEDQTFLDKARWIQEGYDQYGRTFYR